MATEVGTAAPAAAPAATGTVKLTVALPEDAIRAVEAIAAEKHKTKTQVLREAIALKVFVEHELDDDARLLIEREGQTPREIVFTD